MKIYFDEGPEIMTCGVAGEFRRGVPREVTDDLAAILLRKGRLKEFKENLPDAPATEAAAAPEKRARKKEE